MVLVAGDGKCYSLATVPKPNRLLLSLLFTSFFSFGQSSMSVVLTNVKIEQLVQAGVSEAEIAHIIGTTSTFDFDLRSVSTDALLKAGVSEDIIKAMAAREAGTSVQQAQSGLVQPTKGAGSASSNQASLPATALTVTATAYRIVPHQNSFDLQLPGRVQTNCYGSGTLNWSVSCSSVVTPPSDIPINISWIEMYEQVTAGGLVYTLKCTAHWVGSACTILTNGDQFAADINGTTMRLTAHRGGNMGKIVHMKYHVLDIR